MNLYEKLGIDKNATNEEIKAGYRNKAKQAHPDTGGSNDEFHELSTALAVLSDTDRRNKYDNTGEYENEELNNHRSKVLTTVHDSILYVFKKVTADGGYIVDIDVLAVARKHLHDNIENHKGSLKKTEETLEVLTDTKDRFKLKYSARDKPNLLQLYMLNQISTIKAAVKKTENSIQIIEEALVILEDYQFNYKRPTEQTVAYTYTNFYNSVGTGTTT